MAQSATPNRAGRRSHTGRNARRGGAGRDSSLGEVVAGEVVAGGVLDEPRPPNAGDALASLSCLTPMSEMLYASALRLAAALAGDPAREAPRWSGLVSLHQRHAVVSRASSACATTANGPLKIVADHAARQRPSTISSVGDCRFWCGRSPLFVWEIAAFRVRHRPLSV